ncbi:MULTISPECIES: molybdate ABC transporter permease subunit [Dyadobacter]|uniref:Molybdenum transport system permease n=1 Tax=Dyadobacter chenhuakuii TaxID=2909339 RepID=A0A9X1TWJ0_9BACT|nr:MULTISPECIES: molybdate ABC transporter permease subunit [Dyadobacter]MCE7071753.1 molybdate ABC transporter permease subunit [Dyadobacter sp. CY327]MCF2496418.1 molybdate ABC transporter permease subunit [Dyadobacter chenhuakuii]MCF2501157.1 molybdate ABC transporter permease subunit [Dyadobacter chenhuakuii]USJ30475.1 molybdate ABC transporter permease subunit [Dyadobacter chenhuakuii]
MNPEPLWLTFKLATITSLILLVLALPLAYWLAFGKFKGRGIIESLIGMPLVLPPSVIGFYLLLAFSPSYWFGAWIESIFGLRLVFSFPGLVIASVLYSLPFMVYPIRAGLQSLPASLREASYTLGKNEWETFFKVLLPNCKPAILTAFVITFAHTVGEFGVVLMIGGNIPGVTKVASVAIYNEVEALNYGAANDYAIVLFAITFVILLLVYSINNRLLRVRQPS